MIKNIKLKDGTEILFRPLKKKDKNQLTVFFKSLPKEDRLYLRRDITDKETIKQVIISSKSGESPRIIALDKDNIVAYGLLELEKRQWNKHSCEIRLLISKAYRRKGLGMLLARELYSLAISEKVEEIIVKMMKPQKAAISIFKRMGFKEEAVLYDYAIDLEGRKQNLIIMRCNVNEMWKELEEYLEDSDWQRTR
ncbi:GNAT family N-acetyltransferase [bacterium]|nr:GNAT family N-acetyltransferase [bacterium]